MKVIICGMGNIGRHLFEEIKPLNPVCYDPKYEQYKNHSGEFDIAFVCVPTDGMSDGSCDTSIVEQAVKTVGASLFVIKSAVPPRTADYLWSKYGKRIVVSPEYYGTTQHSRRMLDFVILGGDKADCAKVAELYSLVKPGSFRALFTSWEAAELAKYMENCFLALKVTFCNEFAKVSEAAGVPYPELRELFIQDERVGPSHTWVYPRKPYYESHCLDKDIPAFISFAKGFGVDPALMAAVDRINRLARGAFKCGG